MNTQNDKVLAAKLGRQIIEGKITFSQFSQEFPIDSKDSEITNLFDLIEHEPKQGLFGLSKENYDLYSFKIIRAIEQLEK